MYNDSAPVSAIIRTIVYFDLFDYPLTSFEIWKWLWKEGGEAVPYGEVERELEENLEIKKNVIQCGAFWCLKGREKIIATREERYRLAIAKLQRARRIAHLFSYLPWVEGIAACNSLGYRNASPKSDIDFFIITHPHTIWLVRFLTVGLMALLGMRPKDGEIANTICLSFFVTSDAMNLEKLQKSGGDPYLVYWITQLTPLYGRGEIWQRFWEANSWVKQFLPNALPTTGRGTWLYKERHDQSTHHRGSIIASIDKALSRWQISHLPKLLRHRAAVETTDVIINDQMLKFHDNDRREEYRQKWMDSQRLLGVAGQ